jgi:pyruvate/2-oxoglutarate dehydrogenase complex dihydrolipoamide dehydrogenase (E3) component
MGVPMISPDDEFNRDLIANVHPPEWTNPTPATRYNLVVIGAGTAGLVTAAVGAGLGAKVALVERHLMGGDCLNVGCVPSKGMIRAAKAWAAIPRGQEFGLGYPDFMQRDFGAAMARMRRLRARLSHVDSARRFTDLGVDVFIGEGRFTGPDSVEVGDATLRFRRAAICTGARAAALPITGPSSRRRLHGSVAKSPCSSRSTISSLEKTRTRPRSSRIGCITTG